MPLTLGDNARNTTISLVSAVKISEFIRIFEVPFFEKGKRLTIENSPVLKVIIAKRPIKIIAKTNDANLEIGSIPRKEEYAHAMIIIAENAITCPPGLS